MNTTPISIITSRAGKAGKGAAKRRPREHYQRIQQLSIAARKANQAAKNDKTVNP